jgi:hypothetical protein
MQFDRTWAGAAMLRPVCLAIDGEVLVRLISPP